MHERPDSKPKFTDAECGGFIPCTAIQGDERRFAKRKTEFSSQAPNLFRFFHGFLVATTLPIRESGKWTSQRDGEAHKADGINLFVILILESILLPPLAANAYFVPLPARSARKRPPFSWNPPHLGGALSEAVEFVAPPAPRGGRRDKRLTCVSMVVLPVKNSGFFKAAILRHSPFLDTIVSIIDRRTSAVAILWITSLLLMKARHWPSLSLSRVPGSPHGPTKPFWINVLTWAYPVAWHYG